MASKCLLFSVYRASVCLSLNSAGDGKDAEGSRRITQGEYAMEAH